MKESFPTRAEIPTKTLAEMAIPIQAMLALRLYHRLHPEEPVDELHPNEVDRSIRGKAMELWLDEQDGEALSARFRTYLDDSNHGAEPVSLSDTSSLDHILDVISADTDTTFH
ncbi:MAG: hypothetical protein JWM39_182 [Parcubacteria group bacterium]|jgi:hypothetical protein|nr:hypothetical protein [Parcubacteria group bacterium]